MMPLVKLWSDEELDRLRRYSAAGFTTLQAGIALGRNKASVAQKARELGVPLLTTAQARQRQKKREFALTGKYQGRWNSF